MKTIGEIISHHRQKQGWSQERLAKSTLVPLNCIQALEADKFDDLPTNTLTQGYVQLIAQALHIPTETALALLRRDLPKSQPANLWSHSERFPLGYKRWWRPQIFSLISVGFFLLVALGFLLFQWRRLSDVPDLAISNLVNQSIIESPIEISGQTDPQATLTINTQIVSLDPQGRFKFELALPPGERTIVIQSTDSRGRQNEAVYFVTVQ